MIFILVSVASFTVFKSSESSEDSYIGLSDFFKEY